MESRPREFHKRIVEANSKVKETEQLISLLDVGVADKSDELIRLLKGAVALSALNTDPKEFSRQMRIAAAIKWYELGRISQNKGAEIAGLSRSEFIDALSVAKVSPLQLPKNNSGRSLPMRIDRVVVNSSPLIVLFRSGQAELMPKLFSEVVVPEQVYAEILAGKKGDAARTFLPQTDWVIRKKVEITLPVAAWNLGYGKQKGRAGVSSAFLRGG